MTPTPIHRGKARDIYEIPGRPDELLVEATDRLSVFDVVLPDLIPGKGKILTTMTEFWLGRHFINVPNHFVTCDMTGLPPELRAIPDLEGRGMIVRKAEMVPVECIVRGYLYGSVMKEYEEEQTACGVQLPPGLIKASKLREPIFTPTTKAPQGQHDEPMTFEEACELVSRELMEEIRRRSLKIYIEAAAHTQARGIILADTKFEWGIVGGELTLCDEVLTPDSSRFWDASTWRPGTDPHSFDKQFVRGYAEGLGWNKKPPGPALPSDIIRQTQERYQEAAARLTGPPAH